MYLSFAGSKYQSNLNEINKSEQKSVVVQSPESTSKNDSRHNSENSGKPSHGKHFFLLSLLVY